MSKILSQAGNSLADVYDVEGSVAGIDQLETRELPISHEMGGTIFSERFRTTIVRATSAPLNQNTNINVVTTDFPASITRLLGVVVLSDVGARVADLTAVVRNPGTVQEYPVWVFGQAAGDILPIRFVDDGAGPTLRDMLLGNIQATMLPSFVGGVDQGVSPSNEFALRGRTTGFGAGTVTVIGLYYVAFTLLEGLSSRGLPIPSW